MEIFIYILFLSMLFITWVWSHFVQVTTNSVQVTDRVGSTLTWLIMVEGILGVIAIVYGNVVLSSSWRVYLMLMITMIVILIIFWVTYQYVGVVVSHKVPEEDKKKESYTMFIIALLISVVVTMGVALKGDLEIAILFYLTIPIMMIGERFFTVQKKRKDYQKYPKVSEEEIKEAEEALIEKIDKGLEFKVRKNFIERKLDKQREQTREIMEYNKALKKKRKDDKEKGGDS